MKKCPDCQVDPGCPHMEGCDVARCGNCGYQLLFHDNECDNEYNTIWTGVWPGIEECHELNLWIVYRDGEKGDWTKTEDLNTLYNKALSGELTWDKGNSKWVSV
jgi:hypothetical protein